MIDSKDEFKMAHEEADVVVRRAREKNKKWSAWEKKFSPLIEKKIIKSLQHDSFLSEAEAKEVAFHLIDWIVDFAELSELFAKKRWNSAAAQKTIMAFVFHASNHLAAAHRILYGEPLTDVFELGAVKGTGRARRKPGAPHQPQKNTQKVTLQPRSTAFGSSGSVPVAA